MAIATKTKAPSSVNAEGNAINVKGQVLPNALPPAKASKVASKALIDKEERLEDKIVLEELPQALEANAMGDVLMAQATVPAAAAASGSAAATTAAVAAPAAATAGFAGMSSMGLLGAAAGVIGVAAVAGGGGSSSPAAPAIPTFALTAGAATVNEGSTATFTLTTTNVANGTAVAYTITGVNASDVVGGQLTGIAIVQNGVATISVNLAADATTEGAENLTLTLDGKSVSITAAVIDTSITFYTISEALDLVSQRIDLAAAYEIDFAAGLNVGEISVQDFLDYVTEYEGPIVAIIDNAENWNEGGSFFPTYHLVDTLQNLVEASADILEGAGSWTISSTAGYAPGYISVAAAENVLSIIEDADSGVAAFTYDLSDTIGNLVVPSGVSDAVTGGVDVVVTSASAPAASVVALIGATTGVIDAQAVAGLTGTADDIRAIYQALQVRIDGDVALTLTAGPADADDLLAIDGFTTRPIDAQGVSTLTGSSADVMAVYAASKLASPTLNLGGDYAVTLSSSNLLTVAQANNLRADTSGTITATISENAAASLATLTPSANNAYTVVVTGAATVGEMELINAATSVTVVATGVTTLSGTSAALAGHFPANGINYGPAFAVTVNASVATATDLIEIEGVTTGLVTANAVTALTGTVDQVDQIRAWDVVGTGNTLVVDQSTVVVTVTGAADAAKLVAINAYFTPVVVATGIVSITGAEANVRALITADGTTINIDQANAALTVTLTDTIATAANLKTISDHFTGQVDVRTVTLITGTPADASALVTAHNAGTVLLGSAVEFDISGGVATVAQLNAMRAVTSGEITAVVQESDAVTLLTLTGSQTANNYDISVSGPTSAENITTVAAKTSVVLDATGVLNMTANNAVNARAVFDATDINTAPAVAVSIPAGNYTAADLNAISAATSGALNLTGVFSTTTITGTATQVAALVADTTGITFEAANDTSFGRVYNVTGTATATELIAINTSAAKLVNATAVIAIGGTDADLVTVTGFNASTAMAFSGSYTLNVSGNTSVANANTLDGKTTGLITATISPVTITTAKTLTGANAYAITLVDDADTFSAADLNAVNAVTSGVVNAAGIRDTAGADSDLVAQIVGAGAEWATLIEGRELGTIILPTDFAAVVTGVVAADVLIRMDGASSTLIVATGVTTITGTAADIAAIEAVDGNPVRIDLSEDYAATVLNGQTATAAADLVFIDSRTTGVVNATAVTSISGSAANVSTIAANKTAATTTLAGNVAITLTGTASAAELLAANGLTEAVVNATGVTDITSSTYADIWAQVQNNAGILLSNAFTVTVSDSQTVANLNLLSVKTTGAMTATVTETAIATLLTLTETNNVYTINVTGTASVQQLTELNAKTTGTVNLSSLTALTGTSDELAAFLTALPSGLASRNAAVAVTVDDSSRISTVTELNAINGATTGLVNATAITRISGTALELIALDALATGEMITSTTYTATAFGTATAAELNLVDAQTTGTVIATGVTAVTAGLLADYNTLRTALSAGTVTLSANTPMTVTASELLAVSEANTIYNLAQSGVVTATIAGGTASTLVGLSGTGNAYSLTVTNAATTVADLLSLDAKTSVMVDATAVVTSITGSGTEWTSLMNAHLTTPDSIRSIDLNGGTGAGAYNALITGEVTWATVGLVNVDTSVTVKMDGVTTITGSGSADTINLSDAGLFFTADTSSTEVNAGSGVDVISASVGRDTIDGGAGADTINLSTGVNGSGGRDTVAVQTVAVGAIDTIVNFNAEDNNGFISLDDVIKFANVSNYRNLESDGNYNIYGTLVEAIARAADTLTTAHGTSVGGAAAFVYGAEKYVFIDGGNNGYSSLDDAVVNITGTNLAYLSAGNFIA